MFCLPERVIGSKSPYGETREACVSRYTASMPRSIGEEVDARTAEPFQTSLP